MMWMKYNSKKDRLEAIMNNIIENNGWIDASLKDNLITYIQIKNDTVVENQGDKFWITYDIKYLNQCLKKVNRRGNINQFSGHNMKNIES